MGDTGCVGCADEGGFVGGEFVEFWEDVFGEEEGVYGGKCFDIR